MLTEQNANELRNFIYELVKDEIERVRNDASLDRQILNQREIAEYFGVSAFTIREWEGKGMPFVSYGVKLKFYDKNACRSWLMEKSR